MSLAVLARKTRAKQKLRKRGKFILNMTGRGNVLGMNAKMSRGNCKGLTKCAGKRAACCVGVGGSQCCEFPHGGQPAPQQGYRVYLNRKSKGAYRPAGGKQCKTLSGCTSAKSVWKQGSNLDAGEITRKRRDNTLACYTDVYTAKKDTCTGCVAANQDNNLTVGLDGTGTFIGVITPPLGFPPYGALVPNTINGQGVHAIVLDPTANFVVKFDSSGSAISSNFFNSISFVNCLDNSIRTYYTSAASYLQNDVTYPFTPTWKWTPSQSGYSAGSENAYWSAAVGQTLKMYTDTVPDPTNICCPCCPVKKNICGCRATDLVRYTRINKSFGCQTTKAVRMGRSASEQIARRRAAVDCIKPKHKTIYIITDVNSAVFKGCCGNQCLIEGYRYTFHFEALNDTNYPIYIEWCTGLRDILVGKLPQGETGSATITVPKTNCSIPGRGFAKLQVATGTGGTGITDMGLTFEYCKQAFKRPQMLGSCSGR